MTGRPSFVRFSDLLTVGVALSSPLTARFTARLARGAFLAPFAAIAPGPDVDAFMGGVVTAISAGFVILAVFGGLAIVRRILGS